MSWRALAALALALALGAPAVHSAAGADEAPTPTAAQGLPAGGPPALYAAEPELPAQATWPFGEDFSRTSGSGRYAGGAHF